jgi:hypothetical protein
MLHSKGDMGKGYFRFNIYLRLAASLLLGQGKKNTGEDLFYSPNNKVHIKGYAVDGSMF